MNPAPTRSPTRCGSSTASMLSGSTSKSATATTTPPVSAISVGSECARRSASAPPAKVAATVARANGIAIHSIEARMIIILKLGMLSGMAKGGDRDWSELALDALSSEGRRPGGARRAVVELLARQDCCLSAQEIADAIRSGGRRGRHGERLPGGRRPARARPGPAGRGRRRRRALRAGRPRRSSPPSRRLRSLRAADAVLGLGARADDRPPRRSARPPSRRSRGPDPRRMLALLGRLTGRRPRAR